MKRLRRFFLHFPSPLPLIFIIGATMVVILYGKGYRPSLNFLSPDNSRKTINIKPTGLLSATSDPIGAQVYIDGTLRTATNNTLNIDPGWYTVGIAKEGYIPWQKRLRVQGEIVTKTDPFLFPSNPSLSPLTMIGIEEPLLSPDGTKIAYIIPQPTGQNGVVATKAGLWTYELVERPLGFNRDQQQIGQTTPAFDFSGSQIVWSADSNEIMIIKNTTVRLYQTGRLDDFADISSTFETVLENWKEDEQTLQSQKLAAFKQPFIDIATSSAKIISFSPDESKVLYEATAAASIPQIINPPLIGTNPTEEKRTITPGELYVYDSREDRNYFLLSVSEITQTDKTSPLPSAKGVAAKKSPLPSAVPQVQTTPLSYKLYPNIHWFPTSRHLVLTMNGKIDIMEFDRTNWVTVYSGPFIDNFMAPWPNGSRIIVLTNLNPGVSTLPNLYTVNLR